MEMLLEVAANTHTHTYSNTSKEREREGERERARATHASHAHTHTNPGTSHRNASTNLSKPGNKVLSEPGFTAFGIQTAKCGPNLRVSEN